MGLMESSIVSCHRHAFFFRQCQSILSVSKSEVPTHSYKFRSIDSYFFKTWNIVVSAEVVFGSLLCRTHFIAFDVRKTHTNLRRPVLLSGDLFCRSSFVVSVPFQRHLELRHMLGK